MLGQFEEQKMRDKLDFENDECENSGSNGGLTGLNMHNNAKGYDFQLTDNIGGKST